MTLHLSRPNTHKLVITTPDVESANILHRIITRAKRLQDAGEPLLTAVVDAAIGVAHDDPGIGSQTASSTDSDAVATIWGDASASVTPDAPSDSILTCRHCNHHLIGLWLPPDCPACGQPLGRQPL